MIYAYSDKNDRPYGLEGDRGNLDGLDRVVKKSVEDLRPVADEFDAIVVIGMSGVTVGVPVALELGKPLVILRKPNVERAHAEDDMIGRKYVRNRKLLWLDDFVSSGDTRRTVRERTHRAGGNVTHQYMYWDEQLKRVEPYQVLPTEGPLPALRGTASRSLAFSSEEIPF